MKRILLLLFFLGISVSLWAKDERIERLSPEHRQWLEEEVVYIITERERDVFLSLETLEERERFIEAFWRKRDPNPATPQNEFQDEHYRRLEYANQFLGRETVRPGWMTDRGRMYIILGEPRSRESYDGYQEIVSSELWFYQGDPAKGLPSFFYLLFFKRHDIGEYELYNPIVDGPQALLQPQYNSTRNMEQMFDILMKVSPELARASLSFDTSDPADFVSYQASLGTPMLIARIEDSPKRAIRTDYADAWLRYGNRVSAEYSFNFIPSRSTFAVLAGPERTPFVHYGIEIDPQNFSLETDEDRTKFYTTLDVSVEVRDPEGNLIAVNDRETYIELTPSEVQQVQSSPFAYQDDFPVVPGSYTVSVILRNRVLHQYTVAEREITVPVLDESRPWLTDIVAGFQSDLVGGRVEPTEHRTFQIGGLRIHPAADGVFALGETIHALVQMGGVGADDRLRLRLGDGEKVLQEEWKAASDDEAGTVVAEFPLLGMAGGNYEVQAEIVASSGETLATSSIPVQVSPRSFVPRASFVYRRSFNPDVPGLLALARGEQLYNLGQVEAAKAALEQAVAAENPQLPMARWKLAELLLREGQGERVVELLAPLEEAFPQTFEVIGGLGFGYFLQQDYSKAADYLERASKLRPPDTTLLNALGTSFEKTGNLKRAKEMFERSLEIDPEQSAVKEQLARLGQAGAGG